LLKSLDDLKEIKGKEELGTSTMQNNLVANNKIARSLSMCKNFGQHFG